MADEEPGKEEPKQEGEAPEAENLYDIVDRPAPKPAPTKIEGPSVLEGFDEDTDFDKDPALKAARANTRGTERAPMPNPLTISAGEHDDEDKSQDIVITDPLVRPGLLPLKATAITGGVLTLVAAAVKWNSATELGSGLPFAILTIYFCLLHAATGTLALILMSLLQKRPVGQYGLAAARMLVAVSVFLALANLQLPFGASFLIAAPGYLVALMLLFRVRSNIAVQISGIHAAVALAVQLGFLLQELGMPTKGGK